MTSISRQHTAPHPAGGGAEPTATTAVRTMRAAILTAPGQVRIHERPLPEPGHGQVRIRLHGCGVCGSNIPVWVGGRPWFKYPLQPGAPGHEGWGIIDAVAPSVRGLEPGDPVAALSDHAFAEYDLAPASAVLRLPDSLDSTQPIPAEALGCAFNVLARSGIQPGMTVAIIGVGFLGALLIQLACRATAAPASGASPSAPSASQRPLRETSPPTTIIALSRRPFALNIARQMGATHTLALGGTPDHSHIIEQISQLTRGRLCDVVIEAAGAQGTLDLAADLTRIRGRLVIAGYHQDGPRHVNMQQWNWRGLDVINAHEREESAYIRGMRQALHALAAGTLDPAPLYTHQFPLENLAEALETARARPEGFMKAIVRI